jgi:membrane-associated protein
VDLALNPLDAHDLVSTVGLIGVLVIVFAETGLLIGFFLPGDSLLFSAGLFAASGDLSLAGLLVGTPIAAVIGAQTGYAIGRMSGPRLFRRPDSHLFRRENVERARHHLERFGVARAVLLARFVPIVRTFLNPVCGVLRVDSRRFLLWNVVGGVVWTTGVTLLGYWLGSSVPGIDRYLLPMVAVIVVVSAIPVLMEIRRSRVERPDRAGGDDAARPDPGPAPDERPAAR